MMYVIDRHETYRENDEGERTKLANFTAQVIEEIRYTDGVNTNTMMTLTGTQADGKKKARDLPPITINANDFAAMNWPMAQWGVSTFLSPGQGIRDDLRVAILERSKPTRRTIYKHTGWTEINGKPAYLHAGGAITKAGNDETVGVQLPVELSRYRLTPQPAKPSVQATLRLIKLSPETVSWTLLGGTVAPLYGPVDFAIHLAGRTGTFKSELVSLYQSHYGSEMNARSLPASWSSTANALEAQAFLVKNAALVVDDFVPSGSSWQVRAYQATADKIVRSQGNQAGRARLTDTSNLQSTMYPRGIILSTGEDVPEGHSIRARMVIIELAPGDITADALTTAQAKRPLYSGTIAALAQELATRPVDLADRKEKLRTEYISIGHSRTPSTLAALQAVLEHFLAWAARIEAITSADHQSLRERMINSIKATGEQQAVYLETVDPCEQWTGALRQVLGMGAGHFRTVNGGVPMKPDQLGWTQEGGYDGDMPRYKPHGPLLGWVDWARDELYLDTTAGYNIIKKHAPEIVMTKTTLFKRLKEAGLVPRCEEHRQRNTLRIKAEARNRIVLCHTLTSVLDTNELPNDDEALSPDPEGDRE